jgi:hypothetical protein
MITVAPHGAHRQAATCVASLEWAQALGPAPLPATSHTQRWQRAVTDAARELVQRPELQPRLQAATELVLAEAVSIGADGYNEVKSGTKTYRFAPETGCPCQDATHRSRFCKHVVAVLLQQTARRLYAQDVQKEPHMDDTPHIDDDLTPAGLPVVNTPPAAGMTEAPYSATFKAYRKGFSVLLTVRKQDRTDFLEAVNGMPEWLEAQGYTPEPCRLSVAPEAPAPHHPIAPPSCRYHGTQNMQPSKYGEGKFVCSVKVESDGSYCNQIWPRKAKSDH